MTLISRDQIAPIELPEELVECQALGGEVIVRGMDLVDWLRFAALRRRVEAPLADELPDDTAQRVGAQLMPLALHLCVLAGDRQPVYSAAQWSVFAARHPVESMDLFSAAMRLSGQDIDGEKKT